MTKRNNFFPIDKFPELPDFSFLMESAPVPQWYGYTRALGTPVPKSIGVFCRAGVIFTYFRRSEGKARRARNRKVWGHLDYEKSLFRLVRRAWRENRQEKWPREILGTKGTRKERLPSEPFASVSRPGFHAVIFSRGSLSRHAQQTKRKSDYSKSTIVLIVWLVVSIWSLQALSNKSQS